MKTDVIVQYEHHSVEEPWESTQFYCPRCAAQQVWACRNGGDYYQGEQYFCVACGVTWNWPDEPDEGNGREDRQRLAALKSAQARGGCVICEVIDEGAEPDADWVGFDRKP